MYNHIEARHFNMIEPRHINYNALSRAIVNDDGDAVTEVLGKRSAWIIGSMTGLFARLSRWRCPLVVAVGLGKVSAVRALLEAGWDANESAEGNTALHEASIGDNTVIVKLLVEHGAFPRPDELGVDPVQWARALGHDESANIIVNTLRGRYEEVPPNVRPVLYHGARRTYPIDQPVE